MYINKAEAEKTDEVLIDTWWNVNVREMITEQQRVMF